MGIAIKLGLSATVVIVGSIIAALFRETVGVGQHFTALVMVFILFYIWKRPNAKKSYNNTDKSITPSAGWTSDPDDNKTTVSRKKNVGEEN